MEIKGFFGPYRFLSNFWLCPVEYEGRGYTSTEAAYQASKVSPETAHLRDQFIGLAPGKAKRVGRRIPIRNDWEQIKFKVMLDLQRVKYQDAGLKTMLLATGGAYLEETNTWGDEIWGVCNGKGKNALGKLIMQVRKEISK